MAEKLSLQIEIGGQEKVINNVRELKKAIREAEFDAFALAEQFGESDPRVVKIREEVGKLKNAMADASDQAKAFSEDSKFPAVAKSIQGLASGFTAVQGAMGLLGVQSESVEKTLLKVQSALAISEGLGGVIESIDSFKILNSMISSSTILKKADIVVTGLASKAQMFFTGAVATTSTAFKTLKAAIVSTGIGAIIVAVGLLVSKMIEWADSTEDVEKETKKLNDQLEKNNKLTEESLKGIDYVTKMQVANAKKRGASAKELAKIESDADAQRIIELQKNVKEQEKQQGIVRKNKKATQEQNDAANKAVLEADKKLNDEILSQQLKRTEQEASNAEDGRKKQQELNEKKKQDNVQAQKDREQKIKEAQQVELEAYKATLTEREREEFEAGIRLSENRSKLLAAGVTDFKAIEEQYQIEVNAIKKKYSEEENEKLKNIELANLELRKERGLISEDEYQLKIFELKKKYADKDADTLINAEFENLQLRKKKGLVSEEQYQKEFNDIKKKYFIGETGVLYQKELDELDSIKNKGLISEEEYQKKFNQIKNKYYVGELAALYQKELNTLESLKGQGLVTEDAYQKQLSEINKKYINANQLEFANARKTELAELDTKRQQGILSEEEYQKQLYDLNIKYFDSNVSLSARQRESQLQELELKKKQGLVSESEYQKQLFDLNKNYVDSQLSEAARLRDIELQNLELKKEQGLISESEYQRQLYQIKQEGAKSSEDLLNAELEYTKYINTQKEKLAEDERQSQIDKLQSQIEYLDKKNAEFEEDYEQDLQRFEQQKQLLAEQEAIELENVKLTEFERTQIKKKYSDERTNIEVQAAQTERDLAEAKKQVQFDMLAAVGGAIGSLSGMFEKGTAAAKVSALSEIAVNTGLGFLQGLDIAQKGAKATGPAAPFAFPIFYATQIAAVLGAVSKAKAALSQVKGGGSTPNATAPNNAAPVKPQLPQTQVTQLNQESINALGNQAIKAYVIESDMTTNQQRIAAIRQRARFS